MFSRVVSDDVSICLSVPHFATELFSLTDKNRDYLSQWLPWLDFVQCENDTKDFLQLQSQRFSLWESLHVTIFFKGQIAGVAGYNRIDQLNKIGYIGYWLGEKYTGRGIMTKVVEELIEMGDQYVD